MPITHQNNITADFTITAKGDGDMPRPMLGIYGEDIITVEPSTRTTRFTFNQNRGSISDNTSNRVSQFTCKVDPANNRKRVGEIKSDSGGSGFSLPLNISTNFNKTSIGRAGDRFFSGTFIECVFHLSDLTEVASTQIWEEAKVFY